MFVRRCNVIPTSMPNRQQAKVFHDFFYIQDVYPLTCKIANNGILLIMSDYSLNRAPRLIFFEPCFDPWVLFYRSFVTIASK